jgi:pimeloyl-ACP methyl ester carboxylesterase
MVVFFIETYGHSLFSEYQDVPNITEPEAFAAFIETLPLGAFLFLLFAHSIGTLISAFLATLFSGQSRPIPAIVVGVLMLSAGVINLISIPHPVWFQVSEVIIYLPAALLGYKLSLKATQRFTSRR